MKREQGSITIITLVTVLFIMSFVVSTFFIVENRRQAQLETKRETIRIYENGIDDLDGLYQNLIAKANETQNRRKLPTIYQEVEYVESTGTQYIDTGVIQNRNTNFELEVEPTNVASVQALFGTRISQTAGGSFNIYILSASDVRWDYNKTNTKTIKSKVGQKLEIKKINDQFIIESPEDSKTLTINITDLATTSPITIFTINQDTDGPDQRFAKAKLFNCKIYDGDNLIREFVPCYRKADDVIGLYDIVNDEFYKNEGTGKFLKGNDVVKKEKKTPGLYDAQGIKLCTWEESGMDVENYHIASNTSSPYYVLNNKYKTATQVILPDTISKIGYSVFEDCTNLTNITIPNSVTTIEYYAFRGCTGLESVELPASVSSVGDGAFSGCSSLSHGVIQNANIKTNSMNPGNYVFTGSDITDIVFNGTKAQWISTFSNTNWTTDNAAITITCTDGISHTVPTMPPPCLTGDMLVDVVEEDEKGKKRRKKKKIKDITYNDEILVWDFDKGEFATSKPLWIKKAQIANQYNLLKFENGIELKTVSQHRIFNKEAGKFTYTMTEDTPIGTTTFLADGTETKLVSKEVVEEFVEYYNVITNYHMNLFANGILTSCRFNNLYEIKDMKFVKDDRKLASREEYSEIPDEYFHGLRLAEQPKEVNRGNDVCHANSIVEHIKNVYIANEIH